MTLSSSRAVRRSTAEPASLTDQGFGQECLKLQSKEPEQRQRDDQQMVHMAIAGAILMVSIFGLFASAFTAAPSAEASGDCVVPVTSESSQLVMTFMMGFATCFIAKRHRDMTEQMSKVVHTARQCLACVCSYVSSVASAAACYYRSTEGWSAFLGMFMVGTMCTGVIIGLFISAFSAVPDEEPTDDGFASETSQTMKAFTLGWMFMLSLKLRRELVGVVGSSCFLQPC